MRLSWDHHLMTSLSKSIHRIGVETRASIGERDVKIMKRQMAVSRFCEGVGRLLLQTASSPWSWLVGLLALIFHLSMESQFVHSIMHGAYGGLPGAEGFTPKKYETIAVPMRCKTWGDAHHIHHRRPSLLNEDPDTVHPLYRVHEEVRWRWYHVFNTFLAQSIVFECLVFNYDKFLKTVGIRKHDDRGDLKKFAAFILYQYVFFAVLAGENWKQVLIANLLAVLIRNLSVSSLQMASSIGHQVSTRHHRNSEHKTREDWLRFQVETSKNFGFPKLFRPFVGGLDRHIEHHLFPNLPPNRLYECSSQVQKICATHAVIYQEFPSMPLSLRDSFSYLQRLARS
jgi:NADPH-dependent stearoyl-CoA 9-desaturase